MNNKKNIALFVSSLGYGGTELVVSRLSKELTKYYNVTVVIQYNEVETTLHQDIKIIILSKRNKSFKSTKIGQIIDFIKFSLKYPHIIKEEEIDISISFLARQNIINSIAKICNKKLRTIISERCYPSKTYSDLGKFIIPKFYNINDVLFSNSLHINRDLIDNFRLKIPSKVIYNPIFTFSIKPEFNTYSNKCETFKLVTVGRLNPVKNYQSIIKSFKLLDHNFSLDLYGEGCIKDDLKTLVNKLNLNNQITFQGTISDVRTMLVKKHCFVLTSLTEGFPNVILEAMSVGLPVISTNCMSGPLELLNDNEKIATIEKGSFYEAKYGLLVNVNDEEGLVEAIKFYQNNEGIREKHSALAFEKSKKYDIKKIGLQLKTLIDSL